MSLRYYVMRVYLQPGVPEDREALDDVLEENWEPFAVTWDGHRQCYHLRRLDDARG